MRGDDDSDGVYPCVVKKSAIIRIVGTIVLHREGFSLKAVATADGNEFRLRDVFDDVFCVAATVFSCANEA